MKKLFTAILLIALFVFTHNSNAQSTKMEQDVTSVPINQLSLGESNNMKDVLKSQPLTNPIQNNNNPVFKAPVQNNVINPLVFSPQSPMVTFFSESYESAWTIPSTLSPAWTSVGTGDQQWHMNTYTTGWTSTSGSYTPTGGNSTLQSARFHTYDASASTTGDLISPTIDFSTIGTKAVDFYYINTSGTDVVNVYLSTDNGTTWGTTLKTTGVAASWTKYTVILGTTTSTQCKIKFTATSDWGVTDIGLDEVVVRTAASGDAAPISFTATSVSQTGMTIGWTDNSTNETTFRVYKSTDNITFTQSGTDITSTTTAGTGTTYSQVLTGLLPGTTYYFRIAAVAELESPYLTGSQATNAAGTITSIASGNWSAPATWSTGVVPTATDNVIIANGHTVIIDAAATCLDLTVGQGVSGILRYGTTAVNLTVNGSVTVATAGTFDAGAAAGASLVHTLYLGGTTSTSAYASSITANGTFNMCIGAANGRATITFFGVQNSVISGTGTLNFNNTNIINKGTITATSTVTPPLLEIQSAFTVQGANTLGFITTHTAGTLKISGSFTQSNPVYTAVGYTIPAVAGIWINNSNFTVTGQNGSPTVTGLFRVTAGTYNIGAASGNSLGSGTGSVYIIEGGTINVAGRFNLTSAGVYYNQSGGTLSVAKVANATVASASFGITSSTGTSFIMSGGTIILVQRNSGTLGLTTRDWYVVATPTITGGTLQVGTAATVTNFNFRLYGYTPNVVIDNTTNNKRIEVYQTAGLLYIFGTLTVNTGTTFDCLGMSAFPLGNVVNNGIIQGLVAGSRLDFNGSAAQTYSGTGTFGTAAAPFIGTGVGIANYSNVTLNAPIYTTRVNLFGGGSINSNQFNLGIGGTSSVYIQRGGSSGAAGSFDVSPIYNVGSGGITVNYYSTTGMPTTTSGYEIPPSRTVTAFIVNTANGVTLSGGELGATTYTMTLGNLTTDNTNLLTVTGTATTNIVRTAGYVNGPIARTLPLSLVTGSTYLFPVGKSRYNPYELVNPTTGAGGTCVVKAEVFDASSGGTAGLNMTSLNTNRYWGASLTAGATNFTNTFVRLTDTSAGSIASTSAIASSGTQTGTYDLVGGTVPTIVVNTSILTTAPAATTIPGFCAIGTIAVPMTYTSSTTTQNTNILNPNTTNQQIIGIQVVTAGNSSPLSVSSITVNANGTTNTADISNAKLFYTGTTNTFSAINQFGSTVVSPTTTDFAVTGTQVLSLGTNYFWLTFDIPSGATNNNFVDAECTTITVGGTPYVPTIIAPAGNRQIKQLLSGDYIISTALYNKLSGRNISYEKRTRQIEVKVPVYSEQTKTEESRITGYKTEKVTEEYSVPVENGKEVMGRLFALNNDKANKSGDKSVYSGAYPSLTSAVADINTIGVSGPVRFLLDATTYAETYPITINAISGASSVNTLTILPNTGKTVTMSGSSATSIIKLNGADYVTIDGSNNGTGSKDLTISNTSTTGAVVWLSSLGTGLGAKRNTVKNTNIVGGAITSGTYGIFAGGTTTGTAGDDNDSTTITNNTISKAYVGIYAYANTTGLNDILNITSNSIGAADTIVSLGHDGIMVSYATGANISGNTIYNMKVANTTPVGLTVSTGVVSSSINGNLIYNIKYTGTAGYGARGMYVNTGSVTSNLLIANNMVSAIGGDGYSSFSATSPVGMYFDGTTGGLNIYYNSVYMNGNLTYSAATLSTAILFNATTITNVDLRNNVFQNSMNNTTNASARNYAIYSTAPATSFTQINYNDYYVSGSQGVLGYLTTDQGTLTAWKTATGKDVSSVNDDPKFVSTSDLHIDPAQISPVNNAGTPIAGITTDYYGTTRDATTPDIGANEYTALISTLISPANNSTGNPNSLNLVWTKPAGATKYNLVVATDAGFTSVILNDSTLTDSVYTLSNLNPLTTYYWKVGTKFAYWSYFSSTFNFKTISNASTVLLSNPANNAVNQPLSISFKWYKSTDQTFEKKINKGDGVNNSPLAIGNYWLEYSTDSTFAASIVDSTLTDTTKTVSGLSNITTYYWRVKAKNSNGWATFSAIWNFTTIVPAPAVPTLLTPVNNAVDLSVTPVLDWGDVTYAASYRVQVSTSNTFGTTVYDTAGLSLSQITVPSGKLTTKTQYYWRVSSTNAAGTSSYSTVWNLTTAPNAPNVPVLSSPANGSVNLPTTLTLKWYKAIETIENETKAISKYWFEYSTDTTFATGVTVDSLLTDTTKTLAGLNNLTKYFWRLKAKNQTGWGSFSAIWKFTTIVSSPGAPTLISPVNNTTAQPLSLSLLWNKITTATLYHVQLSTDPAFGSFIVNDSTLADTTKALTNLNALTSYYWRVRSFNVSGWSSFSTSWTFKTIGTASQVTLANPVNSSINQPLAFTFNWYKSVDMTLAKGIKGGNDKDGDSPLTVSNYWFEYGTDSTFASVLARDSSLTDTTKAISGLNYITKYYWRVKAKNQIGWGSFSNKFNFTTVPNVPAVPTLLTPANNSVDLALTPTLDWNDITYAVSYRVQVSTSNAFGTTVYDTAGLTVSTIAVPAGKLTTNTAYYWRVNATNISGTSSYSTVWAFTTSPNAPNVPLLIFPANNSSGVSTAFTFTWHKAIETLVTDQQTNNGNKGDSPDAISKYWIQYGTDSTFGTFAGSDSTLTDSSKVISGLNNLTKYFWRVKAKNQTGWGSFSAVWNFTTIVPSSGVPTLVSPVNASTGNPLNLNLVWTKPQYSTQYNVVLATDAGFTTIVLNDSTLTDSVKALTNLNALTTYYWKVRAKNASGWGSFSSANNFKTVGSPTQVVLSTPANGSTGQPVNLTFNWFKAVDQTVMSVGNGNNNKNQTDDPLTVSNYWFELATDAGFTSIVTRDSSLTDTTKAVSGLNNNTAYFWRVKAKNQIGWAVFSSTWNFTTIIAIPVSPVLATPLNNATGISLTPALTWNTVSGAATYRVQVSTDSNFVTTQWDTTGVAGLTTTVPAGKLSQTTKYYWRVNATNAGGTGAWSAKWNFTTLSLYLTLNLKVYLEGFWNGTTQVSDTVTVYLANSTTFTLTDTAKVVLTATGTASMNFNRVTTGSYYVVVNHRNHLETWSKLPQSFVGGTPLSYDFTTAMTQAYGDNMKQVGSVWVLFGGDANTDGSIDGLDVTLLVPQFGTQGYLAADFDGDLDVTGLDVALFVPNFGMTKVVPTLVVIPVIKTKDFDYSRIDSRLTQKDTKKQNNNVQDKSTKKTDPKKNNN